MEIQPLLVFLQEAGLSFVILFVAIDPIGVVPLALAVMGEATAADRARMVNVSVLTAGGVGLAFLLMGQTVLALLGISVDHFAIAGGTVLLFIALRDLTSGTPVLETPTREEMVEVVPIGTPLLAGPATIAALLVLTNQHGIVPVLAAFLANLVAAWAIMRQGSALARLLGRGGLLALSKIVYMFLAAIGVRLVVDGIQSIFFASGT